MDGGTIKLIINSYLLKLARGEEYLPPELIKGFASGMEATFLSDRERSNDGKFTLRMSSLGKPLCQLIMERDGKPKTPVDEVLKPVKFATGDMLEHWLLMVIKASGLPVTDIDISTELEILGQNIKGTADIIIDGVLYDIKSASNYAFKKYTSNGGFDEVYKNDPFGYVVQGYLYAKSLGYPFGGWIVINKNTGEIAVCETPTHSEEYTTEALGRAETAVDAVISNKPFERCYEDEEETFYKKPTGNRVLQFICSYCDYKGECWPNLEHRPQVMSKAMHPKWAWYTSLNSILEKEGA